MPAPQPTARETYRPLDCNLAADAEEEWQAKGGAHHIETCGGFVLHGRKERCKTAHFRAKARISAHSR